MTRREGGFSLIELMIAMTVTLIVSGAIYGLLTAGSNAFRREPEVADRQQSIRLAMDLISRDVYTAGAALPTFAQVFTRTDTGAGAPCPAGLNGCGVPGTMGAAAAATRGGDGQNTDVLELVTVDERCPIQTVCSAGGPTAGNAGPFVTREGVPACMALPGLAMLTNNTAFAIQPAQAGPAGAVCDVNGNSNRNGSLTLGNSLPPWDDSPAILGANPNPPPASVPPQVFLYPARIVRYRIAPSPDDTLPALWRSETGRYTAGGAVAPAPGAAGSPWELVARGIEDLQIEFRSGVLAPAWANQPPPSTNGDWNSLVREVRISLSARAAAPNLQGQMSAPNAPAALRGQLVTVVAPRAAFNELQMGGQTQ